MAMDKALLAAGGGGAIGAGGTIAANYLLPVAWRKYASLVGLGAGLLFAGALTFVRGWKKSAWYAATTAAVATLPRAAEVFLLPSPGPRDLGAVTVDELRAVVTQELRGAHPSMAGAPQGMGSVFGALPIAR